MYILVNSIDAGCFRYGLRINIIFVTVRKMFVLIAIVLCYVSPCKVKSNSISNS